ncbi:MAG: hypothetical protein H2054_03365 [Sphingomonas sp.]|uniref:hypothetical protein n=1 Tax=Sphingomonas sp. TaxID=28214 RepID=UPI000DB283C9|nr:hypothetical protein [Zymomonas sp.]MBA4048383.1 hypothetical protein [Sphingomonas sp.]MBA4772135.1 hypothetical protein [Sphingomonas sp.]PZP19208.1 MAG: hypothetical protein DI607_03060 [Sphingomonas hengshuiensis]
MDIDRILRTEILDAIAAKRAAGKPVDPDQLATELTEKWEEPKGRGSGNWLYQTRDSLRASIVAILAESE